MAKLADAPDLRSGSRKGVSVRCRLGPPFLSAFSSVAEHVIWDDEAEISEFSTLTISSRGGTADTAALKSAAKAYWVKSSREDQTRSDRK